MVRANVVSIKENSGDSFTWTSNTISHVQYSHILLVLPSSSDAVILRKTTSTRRSINLTDFYV